MPHKGDKSNSVLLHVIDHMFRIDDDAGGLIEVST